MSVDNKNNNGVSVVATFTHVCSCKSCAKKIKKLMERKQGVESADIVDGSTVVAKGAFDPEELRDHVFKKTKKNLIVLRPETRHKDRDEKANGAGSGHPEEEEVTRSTRQQDHLAGEQPKKEVVARQKAAGDHTDAGCRRVEATKGQGDTRRKVAVFEVRSDQYRRSLIALITTHIFTTEGVDGVQFDVGSCEMKVEGSFDVGTLVYHVYEKTGDLLKLIKLQETPPEEEEYKRLIREVTHETTAVTEKEATHAAAPADTRRWWSWWRRPSQALN